MVAMVHFGSLWEAKISRKRRLFVKIMESFCVETILRLREVWTSFKSNLNKQDWVYCYQATTACTGLRSSWRDPSDPSYSVSTFPPPCSSPWAGSPSLFRRSESYKEMLLYFWWYLQDVVPARIVLLVTLCLVLINMFNSTTTRIPVSNTVTALEVWLLACMLLVFLSLVEYAVILRQIVIYKRWVVWGVRCEGLIINYPAAGRKTPDLGATIPSVITSTPPHPPAWGTPTTTPPSTTATTHK